MGYNFLFNLTNISYLKKFSSDFYLTFLVDYSSLNDFNINSLFNLVQFNSNLKGIYFVVNKNKVLFSKLNFLKVFIVKLFYLKKDFSIIGLPYCFLQTLFGGFDYSKLVPLFIDLPKNLILLDSFFKNSVQLVSCKNCIKFNSCDGVGILNENRLMWNFRLNGKIRSSSKNIFFNSNDNYIKKITNLINNHVLLSNLEFTDRSIEYVYTNKADVGVSIVSDRVIYFSKFLTKSEFDMEFIFLRKISKSISFLDFLEKNYRQFKFSGYAFSILKYDKLNYRETFYMWPPQTNFSGKSFLNFLGINFSEDNFPQNSKLDIVSVDIIGDKIVSYKLYFRLFDKSFLKGFKYNGFSFDKFNTNNILFSYRLDDEFNITSYKIEPWFNLNDMKYYPKKYLSIYKNKNIRITRVSFDFDKSNNFRKFSIYYGPSINVG